MKTTNSFEKNCKTTVENKTCWAELTSHERNDRDTQPVQKSWVKYCSHIRLTGKSVELWIFERANFYPALKRHHERTYHGIYFNRWYNNTAQLFLWGMKVFWQRFHPTILSAFFSSSKRSRQTIAWEWAKFGQVWSWVECSRKTCRNVT